MKSVYFLGIGGIGMSAIARFFLHEGRLVAGYDLTETALTRRLAQEGADIHYTEDPAAIPAEFRDPASTLVVYTPAVPADHLELKWFREKGFEIEKRSEVLGRISRDTFTMAVAGTHGKTTTTTLVAWLNRIMTGGGGAFLGGISNNFDSNLVLDEVSDMTSAAHSRLAVEADEFDRSFLHLTPDVAVITSVDADHLDIYGDYDAVKEAFVKFADRIEPGGALIMNSRVDIGVKNESIKVYTYSLDDPTADFRAENLRPLPDGRYMFDIVTPGASETMGTAGRKEDRIEGCTLGITGRINVENAVAATAMMWVAAKIEVATTHSIPAVFDPEKLREGLATFQGVRRRFDIHVNAPEAVYMDDYAHHPAEISAALGSLRAMFPGRKITAIFQPHLYSRTADLHEEFATAFSGTDGNPKSGTGALSGADELILTPIYPAREQPIEGVTSELIGRGVTIPWRVVPKEQLAGIIAAADTDVVVTFGAGNIENHVAEIAEVVGRKACHIGEARKAAENPEPSKSAKTP